MSLFNEQVFEKKLLALKDSQDSISSLSDWCLQNKQHHKKIVTTWLGVLKKGWPDFLVYLQIMCVFTFLSNI